VNQIRSLTLLSLALAARARVLPCLALLSSGFTVPLLAQSWSAVGDFSLAANPNGVWTYGCKDAPAAATQCVFGMVSSCAGIATVRELGGVSACSSSVCYPYTGIAPEQGIDWLFMHPRSQAAVRYNTTRFTAPGAGTYQIDASFRLALGGSNPIDAYIVVDSATPSTQSVSLSVPGAAHTFATTFEALAPGDTIDFVIGDGTGDDYGDWGQLQATISLVSPVAEPRDLVLLDADGDGDLDIATANYATNDASLRLNDGTGAFGPPIAVALGAGAIGPVAIAAGDLDGDGAADDLAVACVDSGAVVLVVNPLTAPALSSLHGGMRPRDVGIARLDGNLIADIVIASEGGPLGIGGIFVSLDGGATTQNPLVAGSYRKLALADINGDGDTDVVALNNANGGMLDVLHNGFANGGIVGMQGAQHAAFLGSAVATNSLCCRDFDGDGDMDVAILQSSLVPPSQTLRFFLNTVSGQSVSFTAVNVPTSGAFAADLACGDLESDSLPGAPRLDVAHLDLGGAVTVRHGYQGGAFGATTTAVAGANPVAIAMGDLNGDGCDDIAIANQGSTQASTDLSVILSPTSALTQTYGVGCGGPVISAVGTPTVGSSTFGVRVSNAAVAAPAALLFSPVWNDEPLLPSACRLLVGHPIGDFWFYTNAAGEETFVFGIPAWPWLLGLDLYFQWGVIQIPGGAYEDLVDLSNGLRMQVGS